MNFISIGKTVLRISMAIVISGALTSCQTAESSKVASKQASQTGNTRKQAPDSQPADSSATSGEVKQEARKLVVYYFHGTFRCPSCNTIERLTKAAVETGFADQIKTGRIELKVINVEESGNEHFVQDYALYTKSVILADLKNGNQDTWKNLDKVWTLLRDESKFMEYIQSEVKTYLGS